MDSIWTRWRQRWRRSRRHWLAVAALGTVGVGLIVLMRPAPAPAAEAGGLRTRAALSVSVAKPRLMRWADTLDASGAVFAWHEAVIGATSNGLRLETVPAQIGDRVRRGQVLATFDDRPLRARRAELLAMRQRAQADAEQAALNRDRALRQRSSGAISEQDILASVTRARVAAAEVAVAEAQVQANQLELAYTRVRAPDDGLISARQASVGMVANNGQELFRQILQSRLEWRGELSAERSSQVRPGQPVRIALPDGAFSIGSVRQVAPVLDPGQRQALVQVDLPADGGARAGMYANGQITLGERSALVVPAAAVVIRDGRELAFVVGGSAASATVMQRLVRAGRRQAGLVEVLEGLSAGDAVVVQGAGFLADGDRVQVVAAAAPGAGP